MDRFLIHGGRPLFGSVSVASAKNAVLPILAACLLTEEECAIRNVPALEDVRTMLKLLAALGVSVQHSGRTVRLCAGGRIARSAPYDIVRRMRAGYYVLGPLLGRFGEARVSLPGGCAIGARPVDLHLKGLEALGARVEVEHGYVQARARRLAGAAMRLEGTRGPSVGATANVMMAAVLARGETVIDGAAREPEVVDLAAFLGRLGADIRGAGTPTVRVRGVRRLGGADFRPIPDRVEAGTFAVAAALTGGRVQVRNCRPEHLAAVVDKLGEAGAEVTCERRSLTVTGRGRPRPLCLGTAPYPGFPTDIQAQFTALLAVADGTSVVTENIFEARFLHTMELARMGADIQVSGSVAVIRGVPRLSGAQVMASDLRASAALVLAGLVAEGETEVRRIYHLDRGYERLESKLGALGARIERRGDD
ncbi:MAG TPA: UDP-N-acetylglucosamine 1-carboxyvinyltransferase [candidate division WOR-3 bacterium]|uniref:UDP-N-acetylglucosamine 1-carboxyvinyltransferase n=1 Tax=candidate division WOR-3 bacterium TaxID=2052148 RepID=A0A7V0T6F5_UNCW3|nr:UDP-N-acetylglucosamine 1-carboxyvinyltransferase [candidate division WOR-3 bacterium]